MAKVTGNRDVRSFDERGSVSFAKIHIKYGTFIPRFFFLLTRDRRFPRKVQHQPITMLRAYLCPSPFPPPIHVYVKRDIVSAAA